MDLTSILFLVTTIFGCALKHVEDGEVVCCWRKSSHGFVIEISYSFPMEKEEQTLVITLNQREPLIFLLFWTFHATHNNSNTNLVKVH